LTVAISVFRPSIAVALVILGSIRGVGAQSSARPSCPTAATSRLIGASIGIIDSAALAPFFQRTLSEALTARLPGVSVMPSSGVAGAGSRVRLRGPSGIILTQQPVLFLDGIRVDGALQSIALNAGGQAPSRIDDIPVEDVECIVVLRGPATTARYGTDAAGGIIHVITRNARSDSARGRAFLEGGTTRDVTDYPANFGNASSCTRARAALGQCTASPIRSWSPIEADSPFRTAPLVHAGGHATVVANRKAALGISASGTIDDGAFHKNDHSQYAVGTSGDFHPDSTFSVGGDLWFLGGKTDLPQVGNLMVSIINSALLGSSIDDPVRRGYRDLPLADLELFVTTQDVRRLGGVLHMDWSPRPWLSMSALAGREDSRVQDESSSPLIFFGPPVRVEPQTGVAVGELRNQRTSARVSAVATYGSPTLRHTTEVALDYLHETDRQTNASRNASNWLALDRVTKGVVARQAVAWNDRRFLEVGLRHDVLDRIVELENPTYPFASAAWDIGRESFFPGGHTLSSLRIRGAYGESGDSRPYDVGLFLVPAVPPGTAGTTTSWPVERTRELEGGIDVGFLGDRIAVGATLFSKRVSDGLLEVPAPPSSSGFFMTLGTSGEWRTSGVEVAARARIVDSAPVQADVALTFSTLDNEVTNLGSAFLVGNGWRVMPGYPLYGAWGRGFTVSDANGDGVIVPAEVMLDTAERYLGSPVPTRELGLAPSLVVWRSLRVSALVDYRGGFRSFNSGARLRCNTVCESLYTPNASPVEQARAVAARDANAPWIEDATFVRLREMSVAWTIPPAWSKRIGARSSSVVLAGRNLLTSTDYTGLDPEGAYLGQTLIPQQDLFTLPLPRTVSLRLDLGW
jgi:hypothetical protein